MSNLTPRQELLLAEYAQCQAENSSSATRSWQATSVFLAAIAIAIVLLANILTADSLDRVPALFGIWFSCTGVMAASMFWGWSLWDEWFVQKVAALRMLDIEAELGMRHQLYHFAFQLRSRSLLRTREPWPRGPQYWLSLSPEEQARLDELCAGRQWVFPIPFLRVRLPVPPRRPSPGSLLVALTVTLAFLALGIVLTWWLFNREDGHTIKLFMLAAGLLIG